MDVFWVGMPIVVGFGLLMLFNESLTSLTEYLYERWQGHKWDQRLRDTSCCEHHQAQRQISDAADRLGGMQ